MKLAHLVLAAFLAAASGHAQAKRLVVVKVDGLPAGLIERYAAESDSLPWMRHIFIEKGARVRNFYVRGISLSAPSWSMLETGQHMAIRGNAEFDRFTPHVYDYLNFFPFYVGYARSQRTDMPAVEVLDRFGIPLFIDEFASSERFQSPQMYQRGVRWTTLGRTLRNRILGTPRELFNEWETGFTLGSVLAKEVERDMIAAIGDPKILYLDYFFGDYDHIAHLTEEESSQLAVLSRLDALLGRLWKAIEASPLASETVLVLVSDHGMNSTPGVYSQGYNLVHFFNRQEGGGHHVITTRPPLAEYKLRGLDPFATSVVTPSSESSYLRGQRDYPTAMLDLDGNERAAVQLRNSDWNAIHILLHQLARPELDAPRRAAARRAVLAIIDTHRPGWSRTLVELREELAALHGAGEGWRKMPSGTDEPSRRRNASVETSQREEHDYGEYANAIERMLGLREADLDLASLKIESLIPKGVLGEPNSIRMLQNYVAGLSPEGIVLAEDGALDAGRTFARLNYFTLISGLRVRNVVQPGFGSAPVDFIAVRVNDNQIYLYGDSEHQAVLQSQWHDGQLWLRYTPAHDPIGEFNPAAWDAGFPLRLFEDPELRVSGDRVGWFSDWHPESEWMEAIHRTRYSNGVIGLHEYFQRWHYFQGWRRGLSPLQRFVMRRSESVEPDMLILAADHWNFNARGFNPGGNHGAFFRPSTHSVLMAAGPGIPEGLEIDRPYDSLSLVPTLLALMDRLPEDRRAQYPGPLIEELARFRFPGKSTRNR